MLSLTLRQAEYLVALAETLNFRMAARNCHVTQPALSEQIRVLEGILGVELFERRPRGIQVTGAGQRLIARAQRLLQEAEAFEQEARLAADPFAFPLRLGAIPTVAPYLLPRVLPALRQTLPLLKCYLHEDQTPRLLERLEAGGLDLVLVALPVRTGGFESREILRENFELIAPEVMTFGSRKRLAVEQIEKLDLLLLEDGHCLADQALAYCFWAREREGEPDVRASSMATLLQMVAGGMGVTLLPKMALELELMRNRGLRAWPIAPPTPSRAIGLVWRKGTARQDLIEQACAAIKGSLRP